MVAMASGGTFLAKRPTGAIMPSLVMIKCKETSSARWWPWQPSGTDDQNKNKESQTNKASGMPTNGWDQYGITPEGPPVPMGTWSMTGFSEDQQAVYGVDQSGKVIDQDKFVS